MTKTLHAWKPWAALSLPLVIASHARANVIVVGPTGSYTQIQAAVLAAHEGDTLLVRSGTYAAVTIDGKGLTICADTGQSVTIQGTTTVENLTAAQTVVLASLTGTGTTTTSLSEAAGAGLVLLNDAGAVRVQSCSFTGAGGWGEGTSIDDGNGCCGIANHPAGWAGTRIEACTGGVEMSACTLLGGRAAGPYFTCWCGSGYAGGDGIGVVGSQLALYDCTASGGEGGQAAQFGGTGGAGMRLQSASSTCGAFASGTTLQGGRGGFAWDWVSSIGGDGGDGLIVGAGTIVQLLDTAFLAGQPGDSYLHNSGIPGNDLTGQGQVFTFSVLRLELAVQPVVRESTNLVLTITGAPGDAVELYLSRRTVFQPMPSWRGILLTSNPVPARSMILGTIPVSGVLTTQIAVPDLGAGVAARSLFMQVLRRNASNGVTLGSFAAVSVLDSAY